MSPLDGANNILNLRKLQQNIYQTTTMKLQQKSRMHTAGPVSACTAASVMCVAALGRTGRGGTGDARSSGVHGTLARTATRTLERSIKNANSTQLKLSRHAQHDKWVQDENAITHWQQEPETCSGYPPDAQTTTLRQTQWINNPARTQILARQM